MAISTAITSAAIKGFSELLTKLAVDHAARILSPDRADTIKTDLTPHIESTYKRCSQIKTLLNPNEPADFLAIYATQRFRCGAKHFDQYALVEWIRSEKNNVIITGTGGSGKSMFMRYLWISWFVFSEGRIPIFIELRSLSDISKFDFEQYLFHTLSSGKSSITARDFKRGLSQGDFVIILDGFDELASARRDSVQGAIMELAQNYPATKIVVSGRPDEQFASWTSFSVVNVENLQHRDVLELIEKAPFDPVPRDKFHRKVKSLEFYNSQASFLSNPLLASMMLLTFSYNYDIPDKMHLFYEQAFDALYQRHDRHKPGGYTREFKSKLTEDAFKRLLSYFCLISYYDQRFEFDRSSLLSYIEKAITIEKPAVDSVSFLHDLTNCICLIVKDGLTYSFAHRSFQEYFAAYCLAFVTIRNFRQIVSRLAERHNDQAIPLLADMNPETFRENYILPIADEYEGDLQLKARTKSIPRFLNALGREFQIRWLVKTRDHAIISLAGDTELSRFVILLRKLTPRSPPDTKPIGASRERDLATAKLLFDAAGDDAELVIRGGDRFWYGMRRSDPDFSQIPGDVDAFDASFLSSGMHEYLSDLLKISGSYVKKAQRDSGASSNAMAEIFGTG